MVYANRDIYHGNWKEDNMSGTGKMTYAYGDIYQGDW